MNKVHVTKSEIKILLEKLIKSANKSECWECECLQGFISQLEADTDADISYLVDLFKVADDNMHKCLGCTTCPPADIYKKYLIYRENLIE